MQDSGGERVPGRGLRAREAERPAPPLAERTSFGIGLSTSAVLHAAFVAVALFGGQIFAADPVEEPPAASVSLLSAAEYGALISAAPGTAAPEPTPNPLPEPSLDSAAEQPDGLPASRGSPSPAGFPEVPLPPRSGESPDAIPAESNPVGDAPGPPSVARPPRRPNSGPEEREADASAPPARVAVADDPRSPDPVSSSNDPLPADRTRREDPVDAAAPEAPPAPASPVPDAAPPAEPPASPVSATRADAQQPPEIALVRAQPDAEPPSGSLLPAPEGAVEPDGVAVPAMPLPSPDDVPPASPGRSGIGEDVRPGPAPSGVAPQSDFSEDPVDVALVSGLPPPDPEADRIGLTVAPPAGSPSTSEEAARSIPDAPGPREPEEPEPGVSPPEPQEAGREGVDLAEDLRPPPSGIPTAEEARSESRDAALGSSGDRPPIPPAEAREAVALDSRSVAALPPEPERSLPTDAARAPVVADRPVAAVQSPGERIRPGIAAPVLPVGLQEILRTAPVTSRPLDPVLPDDPPAPDNAPVLSEQAPSLDSGRQGVEVAPPALAPDPTRATPPGLPGGPPASRTALSVSEAGPVAPEDEADAAPASPPARRPPDAAGPPDAIASVFDSLGAAVQNLPREQSNAGIPAVWSGSALTGSEIGYLVDKIGRCWNLRPIIGQEDAENLVVTVRVELTLDGQLKSEPSLVAPNPLPSGNSAFRVAFVQARAAVRECAPYDRLPRDKYSRWRTIEISFNPEGMLNR